MNFTVDGHKVTVLKGDKVSVVEVTRDGFGDNQSFTLKAPEDIIHPVFRKLFQEKLREIVGKDSFRRQSSGTSRYIGAKRREMKWSVRKIKSDFEAEHGDIEEAKDAWDYNKAPKNVEKSGKHGDLKAFLSQRVGRELKL